MPSVAVEKMVPHFKAHNIRKAALFGSAARNQATAGSDVDIIVSFNGKYDLLDIIALKQDLEEALFLPVDLITYESLKEDSFSQSVLLDERIVYEQN